MTTARQIVTLALKDAQVTGVGQIPLAEDVNDTFTTLNNMIAEWRRRRWMIFRLADTAFTSNGGQTYTVGVGGNFNVERPAKLEAAYVRQVNVGPPADQPDYPLTIITSREDYSRITMKRMGPFPDAVFYDPTYPLGTLYPWPIPETTVYELHIVTQAAFAAFATLDDVISLPPEYESALRYNLGKRLLALYPVDDNVKLTTLADESMDAVKTANFAISTLKMPGPLLRQKIYNIYSDQSH